MVHVFVVFVIMWSGGCEDPAIL